MLLGNGTIPPLNDFLFPIEDPLHKGIEYNDIDEDSTSISEDIPSVLDVIHEDENRVEENPEESVFEDGVDYEMKEEPTIEPTNDPTIDPTNEPTNDPTNEPTNEPTNDPTIEPTIDPTIEPTNEPTIDPTSEPTNEPTNDPTIEPTNDPTNEPTIEPTIEPTNDPSDQDFTDEFDYSYDNEEYMYDEEYYEDNDYDMEERPNVGSKEELTDQEKIEAMDYHLPLKHFSKSESTRNSLFPSLDRVLLKGYDSSKETSWKYWIEKNSVYSIEKEEDLTVFYYIVD